jgi:cysteine desulfurase
VVFFPGASLALHKAVTRLGRQDAPAVTSAVERHVMMTAAAQRNRGGFTSGTEFSRVPSAELRPDSEPVGVDSFGRVRVDDLAAVLRGGQVGVVGLAVGNPEVGTLAPLEQVHALCRSAQVPLLVDATMAAGRMILPPHWDALVIDARSWAGGEAVSALILPPATPWRDLDDSEIPELPYLAPSVPACAAAAVGLEMARTDLAARQASDRTLIEQLRIGLAGITDTVVHGDPESRLPHVLGFSLAYVDAEALLLELDRHGIAVASGSACAARSGQPSHVLAAMGSLTSGNVRITLPIGAVPGDIDALLTSLPGIVERMRAEVGL